MTADDTTTTGIPALEVRSPSAVHGTNLRLSLALIVISMAQLMLVLDELIVNTALPHIQGALHFSGSAAKTSPTAPARIGRPCSVSNLSSVA
jgi:hypothetical protein